MKPPNLPGRTKKTTSHGPGRERSEGKFNPGECQELAGAWQEKRRDAARGGSGDNCCRKVCGTWRGGRGAVQGPALPRARAGCAPGALPVGARCQGLSWGKEPRSPQILLPSSQFKPRCALRDGSRSSLDERTVPQFPRLQAAMLRHPPQTSRDANPAHHPSSNPPFPCQRELQRVLSSRKNCSRQGDAGSARLDSPGVPSPPHAALSWFLSPQPRDRYLKRS